MSRRFQFSLRTLLVLMLAVACFFGGIRFERERQRREEAAALKAQAEAEWVRFSFADIARILAEKSQSPIQARDEPN
jgi:hypothetical protein